MTVRRRRYSAEEKEHAVRVVDGDPRPFAVVARELGIGAATLRRWASEARGRQWAEQVARHFGFVTRHGFVLTDVAASTWWEVRATYRSSRSALAVIRSNEYLRVEIQLMRLVDGTLPAYPIFIVDSAPVNTFYADDLLRLRRADADVALAGQGGLLPHEVESQLDFWSSTIRQYGQDFLAGDLRVLDELEQLVRDRAHRRRQEVVIWSPDSASADDGARIVERVRSAVAEEVTVTTRRYRHAGRRTS